MSAILSRDGSAEATTSRAAAQGYIATSSIDEGGGRATLPSPSLGSRSRTRSPNRGQPRIHVPPSLHSMVAGAGAGLVSSIVTCPLDVVKTTLQAQHLARDAQGYEGVRLTIARISRQSGLRGFYRGLGPTVAGYLPTWGIYFFLYDLVKNRLGGWAKTGTYPGVDESVVHVIAAMSAGATGTIMTNPLWVVKTRFMAQAVLPPTAPRYRTTLDAVRTIYRTEGFRAFYKGLLPSLMGVTHVAVQFPLYEKAKAWARRDGHTLSPTEILLCSAFSKMIASLATYPHEVLRTRLQIRRHPSSRPPPATPITPVPAAPAPISIVSHGPPPVPTPLYSPLVTGSNPPIPFTDAAANTRNGRSGWPKGGVVDTMFKIKRQDGWRGFYRGLSINLVRTVPNSAVTMLTYELIMRNLS